MIWLVAIALFAVFGLAGLRFFKLVAWTYVDLLYYPLAAIGVTLLFIANDVQRELAVLGDLAEQGRATLQHLTADRPLLSATPTPAQLDDALTSIEIVRKTADVCTRSPVNVEGKCLGAVDFGKPVEAFLAVARAGNHPSFEDRLLATCTAGDKLMEDLATNSGLSSDVSAPMAAMYKSAVATRTPVLGAALQFADTTKASLDNTYRIAFKPGGTSAALLREVTFEQASLAQLVLFGLSPCTATPKDQLQQLGAWQVATKTQSQKVTELEAQRRQLAGQTKRHPLIAWIQLNLWPYLLILALSLKFGKGAAAVRKAHAS